MLVAIQHGRKGVKKIAAYVNSKVQVALSFRPQVSDTEARERLKAALKGGEI
jgi:hypothetical protein